MLTLAVETSQIQSCVCIIEGSSKEFSLISYKVGSTEVAHSEGLLSLVHECLVESNRKISDIDLFAVGVGPGSFTGIRIGCATIKAFAQVQRKKIIPFSSLRALVFSSGEDFFECNVAMANAYQGQVFAGWFSEKEVWSEEIISATEWVKKWRAQHPRGGQMPVFLGKGALDYWGDIEKAFAGVQPPIPPSVLFANEVGVFMAFCDAQKTAQPLAPEQLFANYMRPSQAEVKYDASFAKKP